MLSGMSLRLDMIGITCLDLAASLAFYRALGVALPDPDGPYVEAALPGGIRLSLNDRAMVESFLGPQPEPAGHRIGLAFLCNSPGEVDAKYSELVAAGSNGHKAPWDAFWGQRYAIIEDPDGNLVDLFCPLPDASAQP